MSHTLAFAAPAWGLGRSGMQNIVKQCVLSDVKPVPSEVVVTVLLRKPIARLSRLNALGNALAQTSSSQPRGHSMKHVIKQTTEGLRIQASVPMQKQQALVEELKKCADGNCSCPTPQGVVA